MSTNEVRFNNIVRKEFGWTPSRIPTEAWFDAMDSSTLTTGSLKSKLGVLNLGANGGINPYTGVAWKAGDRYRLAFVSSTVRDATSTNIDDYNTHVQNAAIAANLGKVTWKAFVSTASVSAKVNTGLTVSDMDTSILNFNSQIVGYNIADMFDSTSSATGVTNKIAYDEYKVGPGLPDLPNTVPFYTFTPIWTGTNINGDSGNVAGSGNVDYGICEAEKGFQWKRGTSASVTEQMHIIAISEVLMIGSSVSQWNDKSGNDRHSTQATGGNQPTYNVSDYRFHDFPTVGHDQAKKFLNTPSFYAKRIYLMTYYDDPDNVFNSFRSVISDPDNTPRWQGQSGANDFAVVTSLGQDNGDFIYKNGSTTPIGANTAVLPMPPTLWRTDLEIGSDNVWRLLAGLQSYHYWEYGAFGEVIFTDGSEDIGIRQKIEGYLAWKWSGAL